MTNILIVDDHQMFVDGLSDILAQEQELRIAGICTTGKTIHRQLAEKQIDLVLLDLQIGSVNGLDICTFIKENHPDVSVLILSMFGEGSVITKAAQRGVDGYILKNSGKEELLRAIHMIRNGQEYFSREVSRIMLTSLRGNTSGNSPGSGFQPPRLSKREKQVLHLIANEHTTAEIADQLHISEKTVESHRSNLFVKLDVRNVAGLVRKAMEWNLLNGE
ncbi:response regulator [Flavilitoribacter nigricans]|nr:response regulator transcription factor [Flavilitoribacter nigricans]